MAAAAIPFPLALPNCSDRCGDVAIPYPFGLTEGCYLNGTREFFINCTNNSAGQPQPLTGNVDVTNISIQGQIDIMMYNAFDCYDKSGTPLENNTKPRLRLAPGFTVSDTLNKFVAVGCDTYAYLNGFKNDAPFSMGCLSVCNDTRNLVNESCDGIGCCQIDIPEGLKQINFTAYSFETHTFVWDFNPCSFAFIIRKDKFNFSSDYLISLQNNKTLPMVLDWAIGNETCEVAANNKSAYVCGGNSTCYNPINGSGTGTVATARTVTKGTHTSKMVAKIIVFLLRLLKMGLTTADVDECNGRNNCTNKEVCVNDPGSYHCRCITGYHRDGDGGACVPDQPAGPPSDQRTGQPSLAINLAIEELKKATNNYDDALIIGRGGFGTVYKGILPDNRIVAIKKSKIVDESQIEQFINEVLVLSQINHRNVVKLLGCCLETSVPLLVYEFVPNGTLFEYIHHENKVSIVSWETCLRIVTEVAEALSYLHSAASTPIIHRDVKPSNILLDSSYTAKVSDFGASRLVPLDQTELATMLWSGFGRDFDLGERRFHLISLKVERSLVMYFLLSLKENRLSEVLEKHIENEGNVVQLREVANLAKKCLRLKGEDRPTMKEVATELEGLRKMEKHSWVNVDPNAEEMEHLLGETSDSSKCDVRNKSTNAYDSVRDHVVLDFDDGR
uniref:Protein kinase domain-containing protein n=1 Tax=Fagus sylvatica TaxID=28930 RepID=A0A2N9FIH5_FAGSY